MKTLVTQLHTFKFDTQKPDEAAAYEKLRAELKATPGRGRRLRVIDVGKHARPSDGPVTLECKHLFSNQWNADKGRVFDWYEGIYPYDVIAKRWRIGHYLDITDEMRAIRRETLACGYTGMQFAPAEAPGAFNTTRQALASEYLRIKHLHLLRLMPVEFDGDRPELTPDELADLLPRYIAVRIAFDGPPSDKIRKEALETYERKERIARYERDGWLWMLGHGIPTDNVLFYDHTGEFGFGWRGGMEPAVAEHLRKRLAGFPAPYTIADPK